jgi:L-ascorbate metabolism protein UlaG (beta-lactamase superfamily)
VLTTPAASRKLTSWGFSAHGMSTWETTSIGDLTVTSVPGRHAPGPFQRVFPPVMGSVLQLDGFRVYVTGDTLSYPWLREVTERCGPLDAMVVHLGGTRALGLLVTMDGEQGADLVELVRPAVTVPVHHDDYTVFRSPLEDFLRACRERDAPTRVRQVRRGERVSLMPGPGPVG